MRSIFALGLLLVSSAANAMTMHCTGWSFIYTELECTVSAPAVKAASFCEVMQRQGGSFQWSRNDTRETKQRADLINAAGKRLCGWRGRPR